MNAVMLPSRVMRVSVENISLVWDQVAPMLEFEPGYRVTHDAEDIRKMLMAAQAHLWIQWNEEDKRVEVINVTLFQNFPRGLFLNCWITCAHEKVNAQWQVFHQCMIEFAEQHKCIAILGQGRVGWMRKFPNVKVGGQFMRIDL